MTERAPKLTLTYYKFSASADTLRLAAAIGKVPFTNRAIDKKDWKPPPGKQGDPRYKLPVLEIEEKGKEKQVISQRNAILNYLGRRGGLYPTDPLEGLQVEYMLDTVSEALRPIEVSASGAVSSLLSSAPWTDEELLRIRERIATDSDVGLPRYLSFFERALHENSENTGSKWLVGTQVSIADLKLYQLVCWISGGTGDGDGPSLLKGIEASLVDKYTLLLKHKMQIETLPEVLSWRAKYLPPYSVFEYRPPFEFRSGGRRLRLGEDDANPSTAAAASVGSSPRGKWSSTTFPRLTLSYFDSTARAEPIRLAAAIGKVPFTNRVISTKEWEESAKRYSPLGRLPTLLVVQPGKELINAPQSTAILRYVGKLGGLYPPGEVDAAQVEFMTETIAEASRLVEMTVTGVVKKLILDVLKKDDDISQIRQRVLENEMCGLPMFLKYFESVIAANKGPGWLVGPNVTVADLALYHLSSWVGGKLDGGILGGEACILDTSFLENYPLIQKHREAIDKLRFVKRFRDQHKPPYSTFDFVPETDSATKSIPDNRARGRPGSDRFPKNVARSKTFDDVLKHPGFSAPSAPKRRSSTEENNGNAQPPEQEKKTDKMMSAPLRRKPSFDGDEAEEPEPPRRKSRGVSLPPRPRPVIIADDDEDEDFTNFSDDSGDSEDLNESSSSILDTSLVDNSLTGGLVRKGSRKKRNEIWDDSSTDSFDDESSFSSVEHDLEGWKTRLRSPLDKETDLSSSSDPASRKRRKDKKKKKKLSKSKRPKDKSPKRKGPSDKAPPDVDWKKFAPKLPANIPRNASGTKTETKATNKSKEEPENEQSTKTPVDGKVAAGGAGKAHETSVPDSKEKKSEKETTPKSPRKTKRPQSGSPKPIKRIPSNDPRGSTRASSLIKVEGLDVVGNDEPNKLATPYHKSAAAPRALQDRPLMYRGDSLRSLVSADNPINDTSASKKKRPLIFYFSIPGRAEAIRLAAVIGNIPFTNLAVRAEEGDTTYKHMAPLGQLPVLEIEEAHNRRLWVPQSLAILRYMGRLGDLYPADPLEALAVDSVCDSVSDALRLIEMTCRVSSRSILEFKTFSEEESVLIRERLAEDEIDGIRGLLSFFERMLENNFSRFGVWIAQSKLTIADLHLYQLLAWLGGSFGACLNGDNLDGFPIDIVKGYPLLELHKERVEEIPEVMNFRSQCPAPYTTFDFPPDGQVEPPTGGLSDKTAAMVEPPKTTRLTLTHANETQNTEPLLLAAAIGKIPFTNKVINTDSEEWRNVYERRVKASQLPVLEIEEPGQEKMLISQPSAILRYLCRIGDLYPKELIKTLEVESMVETILEIQNLLSIASSETIQCFLSGSPWSENEKWSVRRRIARNKEQGLPFYLSYFEKAISANPDSHWLVGSKMTIADLCLYNFFESALSSAAQEQALDLNSSAKHISEDGFSETVLEEYPVLRKHKKRIEKLPPVVSFHSKYMHPYKSFEFRPT